MTSIQDFFATQDLVCSLVSKITDLTKLNQLIKIADDIPNEKYGHNVSNTIKNCVERINFNPETDSVITVKEVIKFPNLYGISIPIIVKTWRELHELALHPSLHGFKLLIDKGLLNNELYTENLPTFFKLYFSIPRDFNNLKLMIISDLNNAVIYYVAKQHFFSVYGYPISHETIDDIQSAGGAKEIWVNKMSNFEFSLNDEENTLSKFDKVHIVFKVSLIRIITNEEIDAMVNFLITGSKNTNNIQYHIWTNDLSKTGISLGAELTLFEEMPVLDNSSSIIETNYIFKTYAAEIDDLFRTFPNLLYFNIAYTDELKKFVDDIPEFRDKVRWYYLFMVSPKDKRKELSEFKIEQSYF